MKTTPNNTLTSRRTIPARLSCYTSIYTLLFVLPLIGAATELRLPSIFSDHMILQQKTYNTFWGVGKPGETVSVSASWGAIAKTNVQPDGHWKLFLKTPEANTGQSITITSSRTITYENVAIGEVWLCVGQSNMGWSMGNSFGADQETPTANHPHLRIYKSQREHWHEPLAFQRDRLARWQPCTPESAAETSAVSYYFGKTLHQNLNIPVGIIVQAFAGTPIEGWMPWEIQKEDPRAVAHKASYDENSKRRETRGDTVEKALATFEAELATYNTKIDRGEIMKNAVRKLSPPIITSPARLGHQYPAHQFNAMIYPIRPYGIRGAIWYQGERNAKNAPQAEHYTTQLERLIGYYRRSWHALSGGHVADDFSFQFTQLPSWNPEQSTPVEGIEASWAVSREAMRLANRKIPNTGMAVTIDTGDAVGLHPKNKKPIGLRHGYLALEKTYNQNITGCGPGLASHTFIDARCILSFDHTGKGLTAANPDKPLGGFAIAGEDQIWHWGRARLRNNTVVVSSPEVNKPAAIRYAWAMNPSRQNLLYNKNGFPASPFRTDDWPLFDPAAELVEVHKPKKPDGYTPQDWKRPEMNP